MPPAQGSEINPVERDVAVLEGLAAAPALSAHQISKCLQQIYEKIADADFSDYDKAAIAKAAPQLIYRLFDVRMRLRGRIGEFEQKGFMSGEIAQGLRNAMRILRYLTDMLGEMLIGYKQETEGTEELRGFSGKDYNTLVNWSFFKAGPVAFRSGDVLAVRGERHNSAAIARIGDVDSQFSHLCIVHVDESDGHYVVESLIEDGAVINTLAWELEHGIARAALYRHRDSGLAARAAKMIHDHVAAAHRPLARRIRYDFSMRLDDRRSLFCSKLVRLAFQLASEGKVALPSYPTHIGMQNRSFLDRIGVKTEDTFAPGDIDLERDFDLVCEWQDYKETSNIRLQDFAMDKLLEWMEVHGYRFQETLAIRVISLLGRLSAHFSDTAKEILSAVAPKVPINMKRRTVATVAMLHKTAEPIYRELQELERASIAQNGRPLYGREIFEHLEAIRRREGRRIGYLVMS